MAQLLRQICFGLAALGALVGAILVVHPVWATQTAALLARHGPPVPELSVPHRSVSDAVRSRSAPARLVRTERKSGRPLRGATSANPAESR
ncbi:MAG: hypothetical protein JOZ93_19385 [Sinobacteraceae bacterium]|nr:hypothetical protein [Nevskiaceae bacterium]